MKAFKVTIKATVTKTIDVNAPNEEQAAIDASGAFSTTNDGSDEHYTEDVLNIVDCGDVAVSTREFVLACVSTADHINTPDLVRVWVGEETIDELKVISALVGGHGLLHSSKSFVGDYEFLDENGAILEDDQLIVEGLFARVYKDGMVGFYLPSKHDDWSIKLDKVNINEEHVVSAA